MRRKGIKLFNISTGRKHQVLCHIMWVSVLLGFASCAQLEYHRAELAYSRPAVFENRGGPQQMGRFKTSYLADQIDNYYRGSHPGPIGVTTFVDIDDLYTSSTFGRLYAEQLMSELSMRGFDVVELRHGEALHFLADTGEFALSRDVTMVRRQRDLGGVIVGTYVVSPIRIYLNARLINPSNSMVLSVGSADIEKTVEVARMLRGGPFRGSLERIPVRHIGHSTFPMMMYPQHMQRFSELEQNWDPMGVSPNPRFSERTPAAPRVGK